MARAAHLESALDIFRCCEKTESHLHHDFYIFPEEILFQTIGFEGCGFLLMRCTYVADFSELKMTSSSQIEEFPVADGSHEEDQLAEMASLADMALTADLLPEKSVPPAEVPVLPDADLNDPYFAADPETADRTQQVPCTECLEICKECREISKRLLRFHL